MLQQQALLLCPVKNPLHKYQQSKPSDDYHPNNDGRNTTHQTSYSHSPTSKAWVSTGLAYGYTTKDYSKYA
jgi:hypothetical protein